MQHEILRVTPAWCLCVLEGCGIPTYIYKNMRNATHWNCFGLYTLIWQNK